MNRILTSRWTKVAVFLACLIPVGLLAWRAWHQDLGANPVEFITHATGDWAIRLLLVTLAVTPLRRLLGVAQVVRFRRMLGLFAFFYGCLHLLTYLWFDKDFDFRDMLADVVKRPFITIGSASLFFMLLLAVTSTAGWIKRLGPRRWQQLHRLVYLSGLAAVIHYYWLVKSDIRLPALYGAILAVLLVSRLFGLRTNLSKEGIKLKLVSIKRQTWNSVTLRFSMQGNKPLTAKPGQFFTFDWVVDGKKLPRSYSLSSSPLRTSDFEVTVKEQGTVSTFLNRSAMEGLTVTAHGPFGQFFFDEKQHSSIVLFAGGSGITPIMSMLRYIEEAATDTDITLFYSVRTERDVIFEEDIIGLQKRLPRFRSHMIVSTPGPEWRGASGLLSRELVESKLGQISQQTFFLCGPPPFMATAKEILMSLGVRGEQIRQERFTTAAPIATTPSTEMHSVYFAKSGKGCDVSATDSLLLVAEKQGIDIPAVCRVGQCGTCATRVLDGEVEMEVEDGLESGLRAQGYRLLCVGHALGPVRLDA